MHFGKYKCVYIISVIDGSANAWLRCTADPSQSNQQLCIATMCLPDSTFIYNKGQEVHVLK